MNTKYIVVAASLAWTAWTACAIEMNKFEYINTIPNIFEDRGISKALSDAMSITNVSMVGALQTNRSDTLNGIYTRIKLTAENILRDLALFSANLEAMKTDSAKLTEFRTKAKNFSQNRDKLKQELTKLEQFKKQNEKALLRSDTRKEAKSEMADTIADFARTFINVAQKAVTDFANMDGKLSIDEAKQTVRQKAQAQVQSQRWTPGVIPAQTKSATWVPGVTPTQMDQTEEMEYPVQRSLTDMPKKPSNLMQNTATSYTGAAAQYEKEMEQEKAVTPRNSINPFEDWDYSEDTSDNEDGV